MLVEKSSGTPAISSPQDSVGNRAAVFAQNALFVNLAPEIFDTISKRIEILTLAPDQVLFEENEPGDCLYLIADGSIKISKRGRGGKQDTRSLPTRNVRQSRRDDEQQNGDRSESEPNRPNLCYRRESRFTTCEQIAGARELRVRCERGGTPGRTRKRRLPASICSQIRSVGVEVKPQCRRRIIVENSGLDRVLPAAQIILHVDCRKFFPVASWQNLNRFTIDFKLESFCRADEQSRRLWFRLERKRPSKCHIEHCYAMRSRVDRRRKNDPMISGVIRQKIDFRIS